ncbi:peptidoglycan-associated lipoprotein Pal [Gilvimarinus sp. SDUM040013]|uniref:Peptidoglycan-associated lipoprotein n=1 Tax=Gilvimarinus gilvus TaxID=3058038 RepID=A0ABU4S5H0_9GAMM|nr:peptidoglycan-associated lipoprotein Pal [Gilvimarinus sp. SDUM040013]MDO3388816.1 peptidoglycan-associated lipoprotein Pal [Gilvimarinus sp. SDUM040013]MDX6850569.1 peptidoglycan-associated lipoprotein Pal [Gilvimarinus sp. SDUM040013]
MITKAMKQGLTLAFVMAFLVGCSSTDTKDSDAEAGANGGVTTGTADSGSLGSADGSEESMEELETIIYFDFDQAVLMPEARALLLAHAEKLRGTDTAVRLEGHADERGSREYNMALGERRANAVRDFLVLQGVSRGNLEVISYGEERPLSLGSGESAWSKNRRVEIDY